MTNQAASRLLSPGDRGSEVRWLKAALRMLGVEVTPGEEREAVFDEGTADALRGWQESVGLEPSGVLDQRTDARLHGLLPDLTDRAVLGVVTTPDGQPLAGRTVRAFDANLRRDRPLTDGDGDGVVTDADGRYELRYTTAELRRRGKRAADLVVRAYAENGDEEAASPILFGAQPIEVVTLVVGSQPPPSAYDRLMQRVQPALGRASLANVNTPRDLSYLAGTTGADAADLAALARAAALAAQADALVEGDAAGADATAAARATSAFFAWVRADVATDLNRLLATPPAELADRLAEAAREGLVPSGPDAAVVTEGIIELRARQLLRAAQAGEPASLGDVLRAIPEDRGLEEPATLAVTRAVVEYGRGEELWEALPAAGLSAAQVREVRLALTLQDVAAGNLRLIEELQKATPDDHDGTATHLAELAPTAWMDLAAAAGGDPTLIPVEAGELEQRVEVLHPSVSFRAKLDRGLLERTTFPAAEVAGFLGAHPDFHLLDTTIEPFLADAGIANDDLRAGLLTAQRMLRVGATQAELALLIPADLGDVTTLASRDREDVAAKLRDVLPEARVASLHERAQRLTLSALAAATLVAPRFADAVSALGAPVAPAATAPAGFPSLQQLFGNQSTCACGQCRSVLGPPAYLVDLLRLLDRAGFGAALRSRRPDIPELELTCENSDVTLAYVDLVLEVLSGAVVFPVSIGLTQAEGADLESGNVPTPVRDELARHVADGLGTLAVEVSVIVSGGPPLRRVVVRERHRRWIATLVRRHLGVFWSGGGFGMASVPDADIDATRAALAAGQAPANLLALIAAEPEAPVIGAPVVTAGPPGDDRYSVELQRGLAVELAGDLLSGTIRLLRLNGAPIREHPAPGVIVDQIADTLDAGRIHPYLADLLPRLRYDVAPVGQPPGTRGRWGLTADVMAVVRYTGDRVALQGVAYGSPPPADDALFSANRDPEADRRLNTAIYPLQLPFDGFREEIRSCLAIAGSSRLELLRAVVPSGRYVTVDDACEVLDAAPAQLAIITEAPAGAARSAALWGLQENGNALTDPFDPSAPAVPADWVGALSRASVLIDRSGLELPTLLALLGTRFIAELAPDVHLDPVLECRPSRITLVGLGAQSIDRLQRLVRLRAITGWSVRDLDLLLRALSRPGPGPLDGDAAIRALAHAQELMRRTGAPGRLVAAWLGAVETAPYVDREADGTLTLPSLYAEVFTDPRFRGPGSADFTLDATGAELAYLTAGGAILSLTDRIAHAAGALRLRPAELTELIGTGPLAVVDDRLTLANLSLLLRQVTLARAAGLSVRQSRILQRLTNIAPLPAQPPAVDAAGRRVLEFLDAVERVRGSGFGVDELALCLDASEPDEVARAERRRDQLLWLTGLQTALRAIAPASGGESTAAALRATLASAGWPDGLIDRVLDGEGDQLGLGSQPVLEVAVTVAAPPALPAGGPFVLAAAGPGQFMLRLTRPPTAGDFTALGQVPGLGPLAAASSPAARLRGRWEDLRNGTRSLVRWLQSVALPRVARPLRFTVPAPRDGAAVRALPAEGLGPAMRLTATDVEIDGLLTSADARRLRSWAAGATNEPDVRAAITPLVGAPTALGVGGAPLTYDPVLRELVLVGYPAAAEVPALAALVDDPDYATAVQALVTAAEAYVEARATRRLLDADAVVGLFLERPSPQQRYAAVQDALVVPLRRRRAGELVSARTGIDGLLLDVLDAAAEAAAPPVDLLGELTAEALLSVAIREPGAADALADALAALDRLDRGGLIVRRLGVLPSEAAWFDPATGFAGLDPLGLGAAAAGTAYGRWRNAVALYALRDAVPGAGATLERVRTAISVSAGIGALAAAFEVAGADVAALLALDVPVNQLSQLRDPAVLERVADACRMLRRLRAPGTALSRLCAAQLDAPAAAAARGLVLARADALAAAPGSVAAAGRLRDHRRAALVAYLMQRDGARDSGELLGRYLLDVEMGPALRTSRIKQAISSTQLYLQRLLLNLEGGSPATLSTLAKQAAWAGSQQVWEAARRVFLRPENWLEPSLRDDKTYLFRTLEGEILQGELSTERAISVFADYLVGLQDLSQLTVRAMYVEAVSATSAVVHVLARTPDQPVRFFYRQWVLADTSRYWTPWEPVDGMTSTEHAVCFVRGRRPYIAWLQVGRALDEVSAGAAEGANWDVELLWSSRGNEGWSAPQKWRSRWRHPVLVNKDDRVSFALRVHDHGGLPQLRVYGAREIGDAVQPVVPIPAGIESSFRLRAAAERSTTHRIEVQVVGELRTSTGSLMYFPINNAKVEIWGRWWIKYDTGGSGQYGTDTPSWPPETAPKILTIDNAAGSVTWTIPIPGLAAADGTWLPFTVLEKWARVYIRVTANGITESVGPINLDTHQHNVVRYGARRTIPPDDPRFQPTRPVRLVNIASFDWENSLALSGGPPGDGSELVPEIATTTHESSGLREGPADAPLVLDGRTLTQSTSVVRFFAVPSAGTDRTRLAAPVYIEESGAGAFLVRRSSDDTWSLLPASEYVAGSVLASLTAGGDTLDLGPQNTSGRMQEVLARVAPASDVSVVEATTDTQFALPSPASTYDWEVFFHVPYLIATAFATQQRYAEALRWMTLIFDPVFAGSTPQDAWRFRPLREEASPGIDQLLTDFARGTLGAAAADSLRAQIDFWRKQPFQPHGIARMRLRAYQWMVFHKVVEIHIGWGDMLFRRDTLESINEATQHYVLAAELLGRPLARMPQQPPLVSPLTYAALAERWDEFSNAWMSFADLPFFKAWLAFLQWLQEHGIVGPDGGGDLSEAINKLASTGSLAFCIPPNERTEAYRATVADRLTKLRASQTIDGVTRQPLVYEPSIDPALLVRAAAAGLDIDVVLGELAAPPPRRRFSAALQRAQEFANEVRTLGSTLLSALEKQDADALARMRAVDERALLDLMTTTRRREIDEAEEALEAARQTRQSAVTRYLHYQRLLGKQQVAIPEENEGIVTELPRLQLVPSASQLDPALQGYGLTMEEADQLGWMTAGNTFSLIGGGFQVASGIAHIVPNTTTGTPPAAQVTFGGSNVGSAFGAVGSFFSMLAGNASFQGTRSGVVAGHQRRYDDWVLQSNLAAREIEEVDRQALVAEIRVDLARKALDTHLMQLDAAKRTEEFMDRKFTNRELYRWMGDRLGQAHSAAFQMAYELAKTAERALARDLGVPTPGLVRTGTWENRRRGLLAGELLCVDLKRLESAYLQGDARELEITKHVSLSELDPVELIRLRQTGTCTFEVPETAYDMDFPRHYFRRLRAVSVSLPCVVGPYRSPSGTLTLLGSRTRISTAARPYAEAANDARFLVEPGGVQSIALSSAQNDGGLFQLDLDDPRYLPFERCGAISRWRFTLARDFRPFDYRTISDLILHVRYTARDGGEQLADAATENLRTLVASAADTGALVRTVSLRRQHPSAWERLRSAPGTPQDITIGEADLPYMLRSSHLSVWRVAVFVEHAGPPDDPSRVTVRCPQRTDAGEVVLTDLDLQPDDTAPITGMSRYDADLREAGLDPVPMVPSSDWQVELAAGPAYDDVVIAVWLSTSAGNGASDFAITTSPLSMERAAAEAGDAAAAFTLFEELREHNFAAAETWLRRASELGDARAAYNLGLLLWERRDVDAAEAELRRGAADPRGAYALGRLLWTERGDPDAAIEWLDRAASADDPAAQRDLGLLLRDRGDLRGARHWLTRAAPVDAQAQQALDALEDPE